MQASGHLQASPHAPSFPVAGMLDELSGQTHLLQPETQMYTYATDPPGCNNTLVPALQGGELNVLLQLPWVDADVIKRISRKGGARSVAELMRMGEQERLELFVTSGKEPMPSSVFFLCLS